MRFMIIVKSCPEFEAELMPDAPEELMAEMAAYHEELARAGVLLDGSGLHPSRTGWRIQYGADGSTRMVDGPFAEAKEMVGGYFLIDVATREEALAIAATCPAAQWATVEVRETGPCFLGAEVAERERAAARALAAGARAA